MPQPLGKGREEVVKEPRTGAEYFRYLPEAYVKNNGVHPQDPRRLWPVVMTFHGMKPYDTWDRQIHEWQEQADAYGYVVVAPWLQSCDSFAEFPLRTEHDYVLRDKEAVIAILDHLLATTRGDPKAVLSTSWSSGGFIAHYVPNRFPHRFRCIATRLSNFSPSLLSESTIPLYRDMPIAVFFGDSDFPACISQSQEAIGWYKARGFAKVDSKMIDYMNHQRIPQTAAAFFARHLGIEPLHPEVATRTLARIRMHDWEPDAQFVASMAPKPPAAAVASATPPIPPVAQKQSPSTMPPPRPTTAVARVSPPAPRSPQDGPSYTNRPLPIYASDQSSSAPPKYALKIDKKPAATPTRPMSRASGSTTGSIYDLTPRRANSASVGSSASPPPRPVDVSTAARDPARRPAATDEVPLRRTPQTVLGTGYRPLSAGPQQYPGRGGSDDGRGAARGARTGSGESRSASVSARAKPHGTDRSEPTKRDSSAWSGSSRPARPVGIRVTAPPDGVSPLYVAFNTDLPTDISRGAEFLWTHNGAPVCDAPRGAKILDTPGTHTLGVLVIARDGQEFRGSTTIRVREPASGARASARRLAS